MVDKRLDRIPDIRKMKKRYVGHYFGFGKNHNFKGMTVTQLLTKGSVDEMLVFIRNYLTNKPFKKELRKFIIEHTHDK